MPQGFTCQSLPLPRGMNTEIAGMYVLWAFTGIYHYFLNKAVFFRGFSSFMMFSF